MALSLFLMLLAFFIVLNGISSYEEHKVKPVMQNIKQTFAPRALRSQKLPSHKRNPLEAMGEGSTVERLQALFRAQIPSADMTYNSSTGVMRVEMAYAKFERAVMAIGQEKPDLDNPDDAPRDFFVPMLAALLDLDDDGRPYRMAMLRTFKRDPVNRFVKRKSMMQKRIQSHGTLASKLVDGGVPGKILGVGFQKYEKSNRAILYFRPYDQYQERNTDETSGASGRGPGGPDLKPETPETAQ